MDARGFEPLPRGAFPAPAKKTIGLKAAGESALLAFALDEEGKSVGEVAAEWGITG